MFEMMNKENEEREDLIQEERTTHTKLSPESQTLSIVLDNSGAQTPKPDLVEEERKFKVDFVDVRPDAEMDNVVFDANTLNYLVEMQAVYAPDPLMFQRQSEVTNIMRSILLDWMMEVCMEFTLKRETFYYAVNYVDRYLSVEPTIEKGEL